MPRSDYEERKEARIERLLNRAEKASKEADASYNSESMRTLRSLPLGQPILVGHHSEKRHRRLLERADNDMRKSVEASKRAATYREAAASANSNDSISSDDPEALVKLREKLDDLERRQAYMKAVNAAHKKFLKSPASLDSSDLSEKAKDVIRTYKPQYSWEPHPFPPYAMQNNNANIRRVKLRLAELERDFAKAEEGVSKTTEHNGFSIVENVDANRVQIMFPGKPSVEVRAVLKSSGFRWAPSEGAWQRHLNAAGINTAKWVAEKLEAMAD